MISIISWFIVILYVCMCVCLMQSSVNHGHIVAKVREDKKEMCLIKITITTTIWATALKTTTRAHTHQHVVLQFGCHGLLQCNVGDVWFSSNQKRVAVASLSKQKKPWKNSRMWKKRENKKNFERNAKEIEVGYGLFSNIDFIGEKFYWLPNVFFV